jgi:hypothetical protein
VPTPLIKDNPAQACYTENMQSLFKSVQSPIALSGMLLLASAISFNAHAAKSSPLMPPPSGDYQCYTWGTTGSVKTPNGSQRTYGQTQSPLGTISLDGQGIYNNSAYQTSGRYNYSSLRGEVRFASGKLARLRAHAELGDQEYRLRFSAQKKTGAGNTPAEADQVCILRDPRFKANKQKAPDLLSGAAWMRVL